MPTITQVTTTDLIAVLPLLVLAGTGMVVLMWDAFEKRPSRIPLTLAVVGSLGAIAAALANIDHNGRAFRGMLLDSTYSNFYAIIFSIAAILAVLLAERNLKDEEVVIGEFAGLVLFAACGMVMLASGMDLIVTFLGLETMSIAFYVMAGLFRKSVRSNEAALKYFLLGSFSAGFFLYGIALLYGTFGSTNLDVMHRLLLNPADAARIVSTPIFWMGTAMLLVGFAFKIAAFPFHQWAPDVYDGAPTVVSGFMSTAGKAAAFSAFVLVFDVALAPVVANTAAQDKLQFILCLLAVGSMVYGNITAIAQTNVKRMLAYSSIAHAGYMLLGVATLNAEGSRAVAVYLTVYTLMQIGAFGVVAFIEKESDGGLFLNDYAGLARRKPMLAFIMTIMMLSLAGIPPLGGFFGKYYLFAAAIRAGLTPYAVIGVIASLVSVYFYLRLIVLMYFREQGETAYGTEIGKSVSILPAGGGAALAIPGTTGAWAALILAAVGLLVLGVAPAIMTGVVQNFFVQP